MGFPLQGGCLYPVREANGTDIQVRTYNNPSSLGIAPHRIAFGLTPSALRLPLKGGVNFKSVRTTKIASRGFSNSPARLELTPRSPPPYHAGET